MTDMREAVARARLALNNQRQCDETGEMCIVSRQALNEVLAVYDAMQPEIDRRVADERAKLLERLREPSEEMLSCVAEAFYEASNMTRWESKGRAAQAFEFALAQFEKENSDG
jgi:hypothetical protein